MKGVKDKTAIIEKYPDIFDKVMKEPMKKFKFAIHCTLTKVVEVEDYDIGSAEMKLEEEIAVDAPTLFDGPGVYQIERIQD